MSEAAAIKDCLGKLGTESGLPEYTEYPGQPIRAGVRSFRVNGEHYYEDWQICSVCGQWVDTYAVNHKPIFAPVGRSGGRQGWTVSGRFVCGDCALPVDAEPLKGQPLDIAAPKMYALASLQSTPDGKPYPADLRRRLTAWPDKTPFLIVSGCPGAGKTHCSWAIALEMARHGRRVTHVDAAEFRERWLGACREQWPEARRRLEGSLMDARWLIFDDLSAANSTEAWKEFVHRLLDHRTTHLLPTLITTAAGRQTKDKTGRDIIVDQGPATEEQYGAAIRSRIRYFQHVALPLRDWRPALTA